MTRPAVPTRSEAPTVAIAAMSLLLVAACSSAGTSPAPTAAPPVTAAAPTDAPSPTAAESATSEPIAATATIGVAETALGEIVVDADGRTLYLFTNDAQGAGTSVCTGGCAEAWPPLLVDAGAEPTAAAGVTGELGTVTRDDGTIQVALNGWPLYVFASDAGPGDTNGQGLNDVWWVLSPAGEPIQGGSGPDEY